MLAIGRRVDRYVVESVIGEGGMAVVYLCRHTALGTVHALKVLQIANRAVQERMLQEGRVQATLRHANIVAVTDVLEIDGMPALLLEFVEGPSLERWLDGYHPTIDEALSLFRGIVSGVRHAHDRGVIHRDLKPANVMLQPSPDGIVPKVTDFGLAKAIGTDQASLKRTRTGTAMGTPAYMAPEQIRDSSSVDRRADVYSLGCILYELVCGRPPYVAPDIMSLFHQVSTGSYPPPESLAPTLSPPIATAIRGALELDPTRRFPDCATLLAAIEGDRPSLQPTPAAVTLPGVLAQKSAGAARVSMLIQERKSHPSMPVEPPERAATWTASLADHQAPIAAPTPKPPTLTTRSMAPVASGAMALVGCGALAVATIVGVAILVPTLGGETTVQAVPVVVPMATGRGGPSEPEPPVTADPPPAAPAIEADAAPAEAPVPTEPAPKKRKPAASTPQPPGQPPTPAVTGASFTFTGASNVWLYAVDGGGKYPAGSVPAGTYDIKAWFDGPDPVAAGRVTVAAGEAITVRCSAAMQQCRR